MSDYHLVVDQALSCSFCGKMESQGVVLVKGPSVYICNECVKLSQELIDEKLKAKAEK